MPAREVCEQILGKPVAQESIREWDLWVERTMSLRGAELDLHDLGYVYEAVPADGVHTYELTVSTGVVVRID